MYKIIYREGFWELYSMQSYSSTCYDDCMENQL